MEVIPFRLRYALEDLLCTVLSLIAVVKWLGL